MFKLLLGIVVAVAGMTITSEAEAGRWSYRSKTVAKGRGCGVSYGHRGVSVNVGGWGGYWGGCGWRSCYSGCGHGHRGHHVGHSRHAFNCSCKACLFPRGYETHKLEHDLLHGVKEPETLPDPEVEALRTEIQGLKEALLKTAINRRVQRHQIAKANAEANKEKFLAAKKENEALASTK